MSQQQTLASKSTIRTLTPVPKTTAQDMLKALTSKSSQPQNTCPKAKPAAPGLVKAAAKTKEAGPQFKPANELWVTKTWYVRQMQLISSSSSADSSTEVQQNFPPKIIAVPKPLCNKSYSKAWLVKLPPRYSIQRHSQQP